MSNDYEHTMTLREGTEDDWAKGLANNTDPYGRRCFTYADQWAALMEARIGDGDPAAVIPEVAQAASREADTDGITGFMYGAAVSILAGCWAHGEVLRRWHNRDVQLGDEGDKANESGGVLNPALLSVQA